MPTMMSTSTVNRVESSRRFVKNVFLPASISATVRYVSTSTRATVTVIIVALIFMFPMVADKPVYESVFTSGEIKDFAAWKQLPSGEYRFILSVRDRNGKEAV